MREWGISGNGYLQTFAMPSLSVRLAPATSTGRCNTGVKFFCRGFKAQRLARPVIQLPCHLVQLRLRVYRQIGSLGEILPEQAVGVLVGASLPWTARFTEVDIDVRHQAELAMIRELLAAVPGELFLQFAW